MYAIIDKNTYEIAIIKAVSNVCKYLEVSKSTFYRNFKGGMWECGDKIVKHPDVFYVKTPKNIKKRLF